MIGDDRIKIIYYRDDEEMEMTFPDDGNLEDFLRAFKTILTFTEFSPDSIKDSIRTADDILEEDLKYSKQVSPTFLTKELIIDALSTEEIKEWLKNIFTLKEPELGDR
jgi:hypothetical protein